MRAHLNPTTGLPQGHLYSAKGQLSDTPFRAVRIICI